MTEPNAQTCPACGAAVPGGVSDQPCPACLMKMGLDSSTDSAENPAFAATTPQSGSFVPLEPAVLAEHFPHLEILELLGQGGMGAVYKARQKKLDRLVALKIIRPESADDPAFAERFNREARTLARLNHPSIVGVHDFGEVVLNAGRLPSGTTLFFFIMEYVDGLNLRQLMESQKLLSDQTLTIIAQICEGLQFAHDEGVVHRDIKPENILIDSRGNVKIADFGLAKLAEHSADNFTLTGTHQVMGTPQYMAPEQMGGSHEVDHRADIYSLGVVFYELLTGEVPMGQFEPPSKKTAVDARLDDVVLRALAREPERRFQSASELRSRVNAVSSVDINSTAEQQSEVTPAHRPGVSTIMEREAVAAWQWVAGDAGSSTKSDRPELPALMMVLLSVAGCLSVLLPWIDAEILKPEAHAAAESATDFAQTRTDLYSMCFWQSPPEDGPGPEEGFGYTGVVPDRLILNGWHHTFNGLDRWPGLVVCGSFALLTLLLIALPAEHRRMVRWLLLMTLLAGLALLHTFLFKLFVERSYVRYPSAHMQLSDGSLHDSMWHVSKNVTNAARIQEPQPYFVLCQTANDEWESPRILGEIDHRLTYRFGFYCAFGLSITMLVLSATGIRHAMAHGVSDSPLNKKPISESDTTPTGVDHVDRVQALVDGPATSLLAVALFLSIANLIGLIGGIFDQGPGYGRGNMDYYMAFCLPGIVVSPMIAFGAWNMRRRNSFGLSMVGAVFGLLPVTLGAILTIPLSVWAIRVLNRSDVRHIFITRARHKKRDAEGLRQPRFSRKAMFAACLPPISFVCLAIFLPWLRLRSVGGYSDMPSTISILALGVVLLFLSFLTTVLGLMAIRDIRRSDGQLAGLGLALAEAAFLPFLVLDTLVCGACWIGLKYSSAPDGDALIVLVLVVSVLVLPGNGLAGWWLWRKVRVE